MRTNALITLFCAIVLSSTRAGTIAVDPTSGSLGLVSGFGGLTLGWEFEVTATEGISVDGLGFWDHQADGFLFGQTFPVGLWDASSGVLLRSSVITSGSVLKTSLHPDGDWRVNSVSPVFLPPGLYRIGALMPDSGANQTIAFGASVQSQTGINVVRHMRQIGSATLAMPDLPMNDPDDANFGPTFTFTAGPLAPSGTVVAPSAYTSTSGPSGINTLVRGTGSPRSYQMQFSAAVLGGLPVGARITELRVRLDTLSGVTVFPTNTTTWPDYQVTLAQAVNPVSSMSTNFSVNMRSPVLVRSGPLVLGANTFTGGSSPNPFGSLITFDTPYVYQGGDLVMLFRHPGSDSANSAFMDDVTTTTAGYGTDFRALSVNSFTGTIGAQASLTIVQLVFNYAVSQSILRVGTNVVIVGSGGPPGGNYHILTSTNAALPMSQWSPLSSIQFDGSGTLRYTNAIDAKLRSRVFRIVWP